MKAVIVGCFIGLVSLQLLVLHHDRVAEIRGLMLAVLRLLIRIQCFRIKVLRALKLRHSLLDGHIGVFDDVSDASGSNPLQFHRRFDCCLHQNVLVLTYNFLL